MNASRLVSAGGGGFGRELLSQIESSPSFLGREAIRQIAFIDDQLASSATGIPIVGSVSSFYPERGDILMIAINEPKAKKNIASLLASRGARFPVFCHDLASIGPRVELGSGAIVGMHSVITCDVSVGNFVTINIRSSLGHDVCVGDFSTVGPHCNLTGSVSIGEMVQIGASVSIRPSVNVGDGSTVGIGSVVIKNVAPQTHGFGIPSVEIGG